MANIIVVYSEEASDEVLSIEVNLSDTMDDSSVKLIKEAAQSFFDALNAITKLPEQKMSTHLSEIADTCGWEARNATWSKDKTTSDSLK